MTITVRVNGHDYRVGKMGALAQFHVARRLTPVLAIMGITAHQLSQAMAKGAASDFDFLPMLGPISEVVSKMTDEESEYVIFTCLGVVERAVVLQGTEPKHQHVTTQGQLVFQDMDMPTMLRLVVAVVQDNLGGFLPGPGAGPQPPGS